GIDGGDVTGIEKPLVVKYIAALALEVTAGDPRSPDQEASEGLAVVRQTLLGLVDDLQLDPPDAATLLGAHLELVFERDPGVLGKQVAYRPEGAHLGHAPPLREMATEQA